MCILSMRCINSMINHVFVLVNNTSDSCFKKLSLPQLPCPIKSYSLLKEVKALFGNTLVKWADNSRKVTEKDCDL